MGHRWTDPPRSWSPVEDSQPMPSVVFLAAMVAITLLAVLALGWQNARCERWAGDDVDRQAACEELRR